ncbi:cupin domain-containing protein [Vibrio sinensis]|nr:cupin domain-containing protein [Vibrio sinensis]
MEPPPGECRVAEAACSENAQSMTGGWAFFHECNIAWRVKYDEFIFVLDGEFILEFDCDKESRKLIAQRGDVVFIPENTLLKYKGKNCTVFYALAPANWKEASKFVSFLDFK